MSPEQLAGLRNFFAAFEPRLPQVVATMYRRLLEAAPEVQPLFKGDFGEQEKRYLRMLQELVRLTRSSHLWPIEPGAGTSSIPAVDRLGAAHSRIGIASEHFGKMKAALLQCFREESSGQFTPEAEAALIFIFDVVARATAGAAGVSEQQLARKNKLPHQTGAEPSKTGKQQFWDWFLRNEDLLFNFEQDKDRVFSLLGHALANVSPDLTFELNPGNDGVRQLVISADGVREAFPAVEALAAVAPPLPRWDVVKFRPRRTVRQLCYGGKTIDPEGAGFALLSDGSELALYLFFDGYDEAENTVWGEIAYLLLRDVLGEYDLEAKLGPIELYRPDARQDIARHPLPELPEMFDERYATLNRMR